jgi:hypothetical protein
MYKGQASRTCTLQNHSDAVRFFYQAHFCSPTPEQTGAD